MRRLGPAAVDMTLFLHGKLFQCPPLGVVRDGPGRQKLRRVCRTSGYAKSGAKADGSRRRAKPSIRMPTTECRPEPHFSKALRSQSALRTTVIHPNRPIRGTRTSSGRRTVGRVRWSSRHQGLRHSRGEMDPRWLLSVLGGRLPPKSFRHLQRLREPRHWSIQFQGNQQ